MNDDAAIRADTLSSRMHELLRVATAPAPLAAPFSIPRAEGERAQDDRYEKPRRVGKSQEERPGLHEAPRLP